jgi:hypothetical protein
VLAMNKRSHEVDRRARYLGVQQTVSQPWNNGRMDVVIRAALAATRSRQSQLKAA